MMGAWRKGLQLEETTFQQKQKESLELAYAVLAEEEARAARAGEVTQEMRSWTIWKRMAHASVIQRYYRAHLRRRAAEWQAYRLYWVVAMQRFYRRRRFHKRYYQLHRNGEHWKQFMEARLPALQQEFLREKQARMDRLVYKPAR